MSQQWYQFRQCSAILRLRSNGTHSLPTEYFIMSLYHFRFQTTFDIYL